MACVLTALVRVNQHLFFWGLRRHIAISSAFRTMSFVIRDCIDQPIILRENRSTTTARYSQPSWVLSDAHPLERIMAIVQVMDLFDEPMKILILARHFGGAYVEEHERANKLQATLDMMSEPKCAPAPDLSGDNIGIESKEREIASLKSSLGMLITALKLMATHNGFKMPELTGDEHPAAIRQLLGAMADNMDEAKSRIEDMMRELAHRHDLNDQPHKMQQVSH